MPIINVNQVAVGTKLAEDLHTSLGGRLFLKGTPIYEREIEILQAFFIREVNIELDELFRLDQKTKETANEVKHDKVNQTSVKKDFNYNYQKAIDSFKISMERVRNGHNIPVMEVRDAINKVLHYVQQQPNVLIGLRRSVNIDGYANEHAIAVGLLSYVIAKWMKVPERELMQVALAGTLMDVGKLKIDRKILQKPGRLNSAEFEEMKKHTLYGYQLIKAAPGLSEGVALAALQHHEREDGSGYPLQLTGNKLHLYSKIVAVADVYHAMSSDRVYKKAESPFIVVEQLLQDSFGKLDPTIVLTFVNEMTQFSVGTLVELSDGSFAKIVFTDRKHPTRPLVETEGRMINLVDARHLSIVKVL